MDDGSTPPLRSLLTEEEEKDLKITWVRHEHFTGLINAKLQGGNKATGDIVVFLDCHVKPADGWWKPIAQKYDGFAILALLQITRKNRLSC